MFRSLKERSDRLRRLSNRAEFRRLHIEALEDRRLLAVITVNSTDGQEGDGDSTDGRCDTGSGSQGTLTGLCTLRAASQHAAVTSGMDTIRFNIPGPGVPRITLSSIVSFHSPVELDATTQPGAGTVEIRSSSGVFNLLTGSSGSTIRGFVINSVEGAIGIIADNNRIVGNRFGTDVTGMLPLPITGTAIGIFGSRNTIGGSSPEDRNTIANSASGVDVIQIQGLMAIDNVIRGNYIGTNVLGNSAMGNSSVGVRILFAPGTTIEDNLIAASGTGISVGGNTATGTVVRGNRVGTDVTGSISDPDQTPANGNEFGNGSGVFVNDAPAVMIENNVIAGSTGVNVDFGYGVHIVNANASGATIKGNRIGVNTAGDGMLPNAADGILIEDAGNIIIGGTSGADRNIISGNAGDGVTLFGRPATPASNIHILGNYIGVDVTGKRDFGNGFRGVHIDSSAPNNTVGGNAANERNIISGNDSDGVIIALAGASGNVVKGNYIGTDSDGINDLGNGRSGVFILNASGNRIGESTGSNFVGNLISGNTLSGVKIQGTSSVDNVVAGNLIGTDKNGTQELPNDEHGVYIFEAQRNRVGDVFSDPPSAPNFPGNVIATKQYGVRIEGTSATRNEVLSNLIGVDISGSKAWNTVAIAGVHVLNAPNNRIGVPNSGTGQGGNTLSHNQHGILIQSIGVSGGTGNLGAIIGGNFIGTDLNGKVSNPPSALGNLQEGIQIEGFANNYIGGQPTGSPQLPGNTIAGNAGNGVSVIGARAVGNTIQGNSIYSNGLLGIDLAANGITGKDLKDADAGPNELQNAPFVVPVVRLDGKYEFVGSLHSTPASAYRVEFFANDFADPSGFGEGQTLIGFLDNVMTNSDGDALFTFQPAQRPTKGFITATVTDVVGNTSEFSCGAPAAGVLAEGHVFGVTTTADDQPGSLRHAIDLANLHAGLDLVAFCLTGSGIQTIRPTSQLPTITDPIFIDGLTFTTATANTQDLELGSNASLVIELDGSMAGPGAHGLHITGGDSFIQGLVINRFKGAGILLEGKGGTAIDSTYLGTNVLGSSALPNVLAGIKIQDSRNNVVGSHLAGSRNLISGNTGSGIEIVGAASTNNLIDGNLIGTGASGTTAVPNATGVLISDSASNLIGARGNVISGNTTSGVAIKGPGSIFNRVDGNRIGTNATGTAELPNATGVSISDASGNFIGGTGNLISGNFDDGIKIIDTEAPGIANANHVYANRIGTNIDGTIALPNQVGVRILNSSSNNIGGLVAGQPGVVGNLISGNLLSGVVIAGLGANGNSVQRNLIGTNFDGTSALANGLDGVTIGSDARDNRIGGRTESERNIISGNQVDGVHMSGLAGQPPQGNRVLGNFIGTDKSGTKRLGNEGAGVFISDGPKNEIGGELTGEGNLISANTQGVVIVGQQAIENIVVGNKIGTDLNGMIGKEPDLAPLHNTEHGVLIDNASKNRIGQVFDPDNLCNPTLSPANIIAGNKKNGIRIDGAMANENLISCNSIHDNGGVEIKGHGIVVQAGIMNAIRYNSIFDNAGRGIDLGDDAITLNDFGDADNGANHLQDYPVVTGLQIGLLSKAITWTLNSDPFKTYQLDFFSNTTPDPSGFGEGKFPIHTEEVTTNQDGNVSVTIGFSNFSSFISATATDSAGNTSEFSMIDTDADALADAWETQGVDTNGNGLEAWELGTFDLNEDGVNDHLSALFLPGASPFHKDIFVEVDSMVGRSPDANAMPQVTSGIAGVGGFANAPNSLVQNPDLKKGITLHAILDENDIPLSDFPNAWTEFDPIKSARFGTANERTNVNSQFILESRRLVYRYAIFGNSHSNSDSSGFSEAAELDSPFGVNDFTVTLGSVAGGSARDQASTFMHELGHTLGLQHGGGQDDNDDSFNYKPNYHSVMNYIWQFGYLNPLFAASWELDYSTEVFQMLDENNLNETLGLSAQAKHAAHRTMVGAGDNDLHGQKIIRESGNIDWSGILEDAAFSAQTGFDPHDAGVDGITDNDSGIRFDANGNGRIDTGANALQGFEDWSKLRFYFLESRQGSADGVHTGTVNEITFDERERLSRLGVDATEIELQALSTTDSGGTFTIIVTYSIANNAAPPFEIAFFSASVPKFDSSGTELGSRLHIDAAMHRGVGVHTLSISHPELEQALVNPSVSYLLAVADPDQIVSEFDATNNDQYFVGVFHRPASASPLVVRGRDPGGRSAGDSNDVVALNASGGNLAITFNGDSHSVSAVEVSSVMVMTQGGDDQFLLGTPIPFVFSAGAGYDILRLTGAGQNLDLSSVANADLQDVEAIDIVGIGTNGLVISTDDVIKLSGGGNRMLLRHDEDDAIGFSSTWAVQPPIFVDGEPLHVLEGAGAQLHISNTRFWRNPLQRFDTNLDGFVSPLDVLIIVNTINAFGSRPLPTPTSADELPKFYIDPSGDGFVSPIDVLQGVNFLNSHSGLGGEGELAEWPSDLGAVLEKGLGPVISYGPPAIWFGRSEITFRQQESKRQASDEYFATRKSAKDGAGTYDRHWKSMAVLGQPELAKVTEDELATILDELSAGIAAGEFGIVWHGTPCRFSS